MTHVQSHVKQRPKKKKIKRRNRTYWIGEIRSSNIESIVI